MFKNILHAYFLFLPLGIISQSLNIQIIDSISNKPIPYSNVYFSNNNGLISDDDGLLMRKKSIGSE